MNGYILAPEVAEAATAWPVELLGIYDNTDPRWHELRTTGIGGSEVGTICGLNKWESAFALWAKKSGKISDWCRPGETCQSCGIYSGKTLCDR